MDGHERFMTVEEVADMLRTSRRRIHELTRTERIPYRRYGRKCLFTHPELLRWLDGAELQSTTLPGGGRRVKPL